MFTTFLVALRPCYRCRFVREKNIDSCHQAKKLMGSLDHANRMLTSTSSRPLFPQSLATSTRSLTSTTTLWRQLGTATCATGPSALVFRALPTRSFCWGYPSTVKRHRSSTGVRFVQRGSPAHRSKCHSSLKFCLSVGKETKLAPSADEYIHMRFTWTYCILSCRPWYYCVRSFPGPFSQEQCMQGHLRSHLLQCPEDQ